MICAGMSVLLGVGRAAEVPTPEPLEIRLDYAAAVVLGRITKVEKIESPGAVHQERVTLAVKEMLKGAPAATIETTGYSHVGYRVGDSGIWLVDSEGHLVWPHGHLEEGQKPEVQRIVKMLAERAWSAEVHGVRGWAVALSSADLGSREILFAVQNRTKHDVFLPHPNCRADILTIAVKSADGKEFTFPLKDGTPCPVIHCDKLTAGQTDYLADYHIYGKWSAELPSGKYQVTLAYRNSRDGVLLTAVGMPDPPVDAWKGELVTPPFEIVVNRAKGVPKTVVVP